MRIDELRRDVTLLIDAVEVCAESLGGEYGYSYAPIARNVQWAIEDGIDGEQAFAAYERLKRWVGTDD